MRTTRQCEKTQKIKVVNFVKDEPFVPQWQIQEVRRRDALMVNNPEYLLDCDVVISETARNPQIWEQRIF